jgi:hypothetical protein
VSAHQPPTLDALDANLRRVAARVAQLEDSISIYGPPPRRRRLPIPEIGAAQREFLVWMAVFATLSVITAATKRRGGE